MTMEMTNDEPTAKCRRCKQDKTLDNYHKDKRTPNGHYDVCRQCRILHRGITRNAEKNKEAILQSQNNACAICGLTAQKDERTFVIDHNHDTHLVRGILCSNCNVGLGYFKDQPGRLAMAIKYLMDTDGTAT
jgi:hypothetical protein